ncbi:MAG: outer membrane protein transport protein [Gammaproteobacteria bacterium]|nr:outer membrane protein transport protein [Gammaproteobacteria bacterium]
MKHLSRIRFYFVLASTLTLFSGSAFGAFFQVQESSPRGAGNANAGGAAVAEDASTVWYNPAGLTRLEGRQLVVGGHLILPSTNFDNQGSTTTALLGPASGPLTGGDGGDAGDDALVPNLYYARPINDDLTFGIGLNVPFGLRTEYDDGWVGRYHALESEVKTININPGVGYQLTDQVSIGGGINVQIVDATLSQALDFGSICFLTQPLPVCSTLGLAPQANDGEAEVEADDTGYGYNIGVLFKLNDRTRIGVAHRSVIRLELEGDSDVTTRDPGSATLAAGAGIVNADVEADVTFPATTSISVHHQVNSQWAVMGDATQTRWGRLPELRIKFESSQPDTVNTFDLDDVWRYSFGATYMRNSRLTYRFGIAFDESPTPNAEVRSARLPDEDRTWLTFGVDYKKNDRLNFDFSYVFVAIDDADINKNANSATGEDLFRGNLVGEYDADTSILAGQVNWKFQTR